MYRNEEVTAEWCGSPVQPCADCNFTSFIDTIADQCADRIMCPIVAQKLMDLSIAVDSCYSNSKQINVHICLHLHSDALAVMIPNALMYNSALLIVHFNIT